MFVVARVCVLNQKRRTMPLLAWVWPARGYGPLLPCSSHTFTPRHADADAPVYWKRILLLFGTRSCM